MNTFGEAFKVTIFGQSHSESVGAVVEGVPSGTVIDEEALAAFMTRRKPNRGVGTSPRNEADRVRIVAGTTAGGVCCGAPLCMMIDNEDARPEDYAGLADTPRPSHVDYAASIKENGHCDVCGGGRYSGRLTAPLCAAGYVAETVLSRRYGVEVGVHLLSVGGVTDRAFDSCRVSREELERLKHMGFPVLEADNGAKMEKRITSAAAEGDSVGGCVECALIGLKPGVGGPMFDGIENALSRAIFGIPGVKAVEFGAGRDFADLTGTESNDAFCTDGTRLYTETNRSGGINGGLSNGMPIVLRATFRPTPSIAVPQQTVSLSRMENTLLTIKGRHDASIAVRGAVCVEAAAAIAILDLLLKNE